MCSLDALNEGHTLYGKWTLLFRGWRSLDNNIVRTKSSLPMVKCQFSLFRWCSTLWWSKILVNPLTGDVCNGDRWVIVIFPFHVELQKHIIPRIPGENFKSCAWLGWVLKVLDSKCQPDPYPWSIPKNGKLYLGQVRYTLSERTGQSSYIYIHTYVFYSFHTFWSPEKRIHTRFLSCCYLSKRSETINADSRVALAQLSCWDSNGAQWLLQRYGSRLLYNPNKYASLLSMFDFDPFWDSFATKVWTHTVMW